MKNLVIKDVPDALVLLGILLGVAVVVVGYIGFGYAIGGLITTAIKALF